MRPPQECPHCHADLSDPVARSRPDRYPDPLLFGRVLTNEVKATGQRVWQCPDCLRTWGRPDPVPTPGATPGMNRAARRAFARALRRGGIPT